MPKAKHWAVAYIVAVQSAVGFSQEFPSPSDVHPSARGVAIAPPQEIPLDVVVQKPEPKSLGQHRTTVQVPVQTILKPQLPIQSVIQPPHTTAVPTLAPAVDSIISDQQVDNIANAAKQKQAEALKKKVTGAYKDTFFDNDFNYLRDPGYTGYNVGENLKQISVGPGKLDIGGQYRLRYHNEHNMRGTGLTGRDDSFVLDRTRVYFDHKMSKNMRVYSEFLDAGSTYENFAPRAIEVQHLDLQNLFLDAVLTESANGKLTSRLGRQELLLGSQRLISPLDWANTRRTFDGGRLTWADDQRTLDAFLTRPVIVNPRDPDSPNLDQTFYGIYNQNKAFENGQLDTYYLGFQNELIDQRVHTVGSRWSGEADQWLWDNELGYQFGQNPDGSDISAAAITIGAGRRLQGASKPALWFYYDWASGDDSVNNGWNQLFPLAHKYNGFMDLYGRRNLNDVNVLFTAAPTQKWTVLAWYHYFFLANGNQGPYNVNLTAFNAGGTVGSRDLGQEIDFLATRKLSVRSDLVLGYSHFFSGKYYDSSTNSAAAPLFNGDADFFYTQYHFNF